MNLPSSGTGSVARPSSRTGMVPAWVPTYMLHYICYRSEEYQVCCQWDKILHSSPEDTYPAISGAYLQHTDDPGTLKRELFATLSNATQ